MTRRFISDVATYQREQQGQALMVSDLCFPLLAQEANNP